MASIEELAAKAKAKQSKKKKEEPFDVPKRPWDYFRGDDIDEGPVNSDALKSVLSTATTTPLPAIKVEEKTPENLSIAPKNAVEESTPEVSEIQSVVAPLSISSQRIANQEPTTDRPLVDNESAISRLQVDDSPTTSRPVIDAVPTVSRQVVNKLSKARRPPVDSSSTNSRPFVESVAGTVVDYSSAKPLLDQLGDIPLWSYLGPAQGQMLLAIYKKCDLSSLSTQMLPKSYFTATCDISEKSVGSTIEKLVRKGLISRLLGKGGVGGFTRFTIPQIVYQRMKETGADHAAASIVDPLPNQLSHQLSAASRIDRIVSLNKTNLSDLEIPKEPEFSFDYGDWTSISFETLPDFANSFRLEKLRADITNQRLGITVDEVQSMIDRFQVFAKGLPKGPLNPYALFMKILRDKVLHGKDLLAGTESMYEVWASEARKKKIADYEVEYHECFLKWEAATPADERREAVQGIAGNLGNTLDLDSVDFRNYLISYFRDNVWKKKDANSHTSAEPSL